MWENPFFKGFLRNKKLVTRNNFANKKRPFLGQKSRSLACKSDQTARKKRARNFMQNLEEGNLNNWA